MQADGPVASALYAPATHAVHTADVLAVPTLPYQPARHAVQADVPKTTALYAPTAHAVQTVAAHAVATVPNLPAAHARHAAGSVVPVAVAVWYEPATHAVACQCGRVRQGVKARDWGMRADSATGRFHLRHQIRYYSTCPLQIRKGEEVVSAATSTVTPT